VKKQLSNLESKENTLHKRRTGSLQSSDTTTIQQIGPKEAYSNFQLSPSSRRVKELSQMHPELITTESEECSRLDNSTNYAAYKEEKKSVVVDEIRRLRVGHEPVVRNLNLNIDFEKSMDLSKQPKVPDSCHSSISNRAQPLKRLKSADQRLRKMIIPQPVNIFAASINSDNGYVQPIHKHLKDPRDPLLGFSAYMQNMNTVLKKTSSFKSSTLAKALRQSPVKRKPSRGNLNTQDDEMLDKHFLMMTTGEGSKKPSSVQPYIKQLAATKQSFRPPEISKVNLNTNMFESKPNNGFNCQIQNNTVYMIPGMFDMPRKNDSSANNTYNFNRYRALSSAKKSLNISKTRIYQ